MTHSFQVLLTQTKAALYVIYAIFVILFFCPESKPQQIRDSCYALLILRAAVVFGRIGQGAARRRAAARQVNSIAAHTQKQQHKNFKHNHRTIVENFMREIVQNSSQVSLDILTLKIDTAWLFTDILLQMVFAVINLYLDPSFRKIHETILIFQLKSKPTNQQREKCMRTSYVRIMHIHNLAKGESFIRDY